MAYVGEKSHGAEGSRLNAVAFLDSQVGGVLTYGKSLGHESRSGEKMSQVCFLL